MKTLETLCIFVLAFVSCLFLSCGDDNDSSDNSEINAQCTKTINQLTGTTWKQQSHRFLRNGVIKNRDVLYGTLSFGSDHNLFINSRLAGGWFVPLPDRLHLAWAHDGEFNAVECLLAMGNGGHILYS